MPRSRIAAVAALALTVVLLSPTTASADIGRGAAGSGKQSGLSWAVFRGELTDLIPGEPGPFDRASATALMIGHRSSTFVLHVSGVDPSVAGEGFGAHLHVDSCVFGDGAAAGPHYNINAVNHISPTDPSDKTEVWLDFVVDGDGGGQATAHVPWVPAPGMHAIVIHKEATKGDGTAGARQACIPLLVH